MRSDHFRETTKTVNVRLTMCYAMLGGLLAATGCDRSPDVRATPSDDSGQKQLPETVREESAAAPEADPDEGVVRMLDIGPPLPHEPGEVLLRGVTIHVEGRDIELNNGILVFGEAGLAVRDAATGNLAWRAHTCVNPDCPSRTDPPPYIFVHSAPGAYVNKGGYVVAPGPPDVLVPVCAACGRRDTAKVYELPEVVKRQAELDEELSAWDAADRAGQPIPAGVRPAMEILRDRALQPTLYLLPE